jgi:ubiquinone/menaquinone biosynthesis C-methylase UbiE
MRRSPLTHSGPDPGEASARYCELAAGYDRRGALARPLRGAAVRALRLEAGDHVLEVGCGTGLNFSRMEAGIGPSGRLTGVDLSAEMLAGSRKRVEASGWGDVALLHREVRDMDIPEGVDKVLMFLVHDITRSPDALVHLAKATAGARVVACGPKLAPRWAWPLNAVVRRGVRPYVTTLEGLDEPWSHLSRLAPDLKVKSMALGAMYVATGHFSADP